ncbi:DUF2207 domain-containing protein [Gorillibacterium sp. sgz5001074]|uniref:DUF2207 domain-containing protein n=1 Tax=Gorillibacterium sp. sgz5001074 TaxID=3446695 RepID=UPI003F66426D
MAIKRGIALLLLILLWLTGQGKVKAEDYAVQLDYNGYRITGYQIETIVNKDASIDVTERITADFVQPKHGIYREVPLTGSMVLEYENARTQLRYLAKVTEIAVKDPASSAEIPYRKAWVGQSLRIQIGDSNRTYTGSKTYELQYHYALQTSKGIPLNGLSYNLIGTGWDTSISHIQFAIRLPEDTVPNRIAISSGAVGSKYTPNMEYSVQDGLITGVVNEILDPGDGLTLMMELSENALQPPKAASGYIEMLAFTVLAGVSVAFWLIYGRRRRSSSQMAGMDPIRLNPAAMSYVMHGSASSQSLSAMILYWADLGYLKVMDEGKQVLRLVKLREPDESLQPYDRKMLERLFNGKESVTAAELGDDFYKAFRDWKEGIARDFQTPERLIYERSPLYALAGGAIFSASIITVLACQAMAFFCVDLADVLLILITGILTWFMVLLGSLLLIYFADRLSIRMPLGFIVCGTVFGLFLWWFANLTGDMMLNPWLYGAGSVAAGVCALAGAFSKRRTEYGSRLLKQVLNYKTELQQMYGSKNSEQPQDEGACYKDLPYVFLFGLTSKWTASLQRFTGAKPPEWYQAQPGSGFEPVQYAAYLNKSMGSFESSSSGGDSSGGGSGSGAGGGGGGSW